MTSWSRQSSAVLVRERICRSALNKSGIPGVDYCVNPYTGCSHGCVYCYATFMARYSGHVEPWGTFVDAKVNLPDVLSREVKRRPRGFVVVGTVCDPYQPAEAEFGLTRRAIAILSRARFEFRLLTKSDLVVRDIDVLRDCPNGGVQMTLTGLSDDVASFFEPGAPTMTRRLAAVERLCRAGVDVGAFFGPILPYFADRPDRIDALFFPAEAGRHTPGTGGQAQLPEGQVPDDSALVAALSTRGAARVRAGPARARVVR